MQNNSLAKKKAHHSSKTKHDLFLLRRDLWYCKAIYTEFAFIGWYTTLSTKECESTSP